MFNHVLIYMGSIDTILLIYPGCWNCDNGKFSDVLTEYGGKLYAVSVNQNYFDGQVGGTFLSFRI